MPRRFKCVLDEDTKYQKQFIRQLRRLWLRSPSRYEVIRRARMRPGRYRCAICREDFPLTNIRVDHKQPVVPIKRKINWREQLERLFIVSRGMQALCKECHSVKTKSENDQRKS